MLTLYSTRTCAWCVQVEKLFKNKNVAYEKVYIDDDMDLRQMLLDKTGMTAVPVTSDGNQYIVGWNPAKLMELIRAQN